jgi:hypothetical protein
LKQCCIPLIIILASRISLWICRFWCWYDRWALRTTCTGYTNIHIRIPLLIWWACSTCSCIYIPHWLLRGTNSNYSTASRWLATIRFSYKNISRRACGCLYRSIISLWAWFNWKFSTCTLVSWNIIIRLF